MEPIKTLTDQLSSPDDEIRRSAVISLATFPMDRVKGFLLQALGDVSWRVRKEAIEAVLAAVGSEVEIEDLVTLLRAHDNAGMRNSAVEALCRIGERALPVLSRYLHDADHDVRKFIIDIVGDIGATESLPLLIDALEDQDQNVCAAAIENIGKLRVAAAHAHLVKCLAKPDMMLRFAALEALARLGKPVPLPELLPLVRENFLKKGVFDCLGSVADAEAVPLLVEGLQENRSVRDAAAAALVRIRNASPDLQRLVDARLALLKHSAVVDGLLASLAVATEWQMKEHIIALLGVIGDERAASRLLEEISAGCSSKPCLAAFASMGKAGVSFLLDAFPAANEAQRRFIAYACGELSVPDCADLLWQGMRDGDADLRAVSAVSAGKTAQGGLVDQVVALLDDPVPDVRAAAIMALSSLAECTGDTLLKLAEMFFASNWPEKRCNSVTLFTVLGDVERLSILVKDEDVAVRKAAVHALAKTGSRAGLNHLVLALVDEDPDVRSAAAQALGQVGGPDVLDLLILVLKDDDPWVRIDAIKSLGMLGDAKACEAISPIALSDEPPVVIAALECVAALCGNGAVDLLLTSLDHPDEEVVKAAVELLSKLDDSWIDASKDRLLEHPHWDVRRAFIRTLAMLRGEKALPDFKAAQAKESDELVQRLLSDLLERLQ